MLDTAAANSCGSVQVCTHVSCRHPPLPEHYHPPGTVWPRLTQPMLPPLEREGHEECCSASGPSGSPPCMR